MLPRALRSAHRVPGEDSVRIVLGVDSGTAVNIGGVKIDGNCLAETCQCRGNLVWQRDPGFYVLIRRATNSLSRPGGLALLSRPIRSSLHAETESDSVPHDP